MLGPDLQQDLDGFLAAREGEFIEFRRDLHAHPELGYQEHRTTSRIMLRLAAAGLNPVTLPKGTGVVADIGDPRAGGPLIALRAQLDAVPIMDEKTVSYRSTVAHCCHACGHDVHATVLLGAGLFLAARAHAGTMPGRVRLIFEPAEEVASGARDVIEAGGLDGVSRIFALHCDPRLDVGKVGTRPGPITAACDRIEVRLRGPGGHTSRPHLTADLVYALAKIVTELPAALSRRVDPRSSMSLVWGQMSAGTALNAIPEEGMAVGTVRCLDDRAWQDAPGLLQELVDAVASAYGVTTEVRYRRSMPGAVNETVSTAILETAAVEVLGAAAVTQTPQSLDSDDFAWYLDEVPGALARLGTQTPGPAAPVDLHQPTFDVDERAIGVGIRLMAATAITSLCLGASAPRDSALA